MMRKLNHQGIAIIITMLILSSILVVGLGTASIINKSLHNTKISNWSSIAYLAAETGAERIIYLGRNELESAFEGMLCAGYINLNTLACGEYSHNIGSGLTYKVKYGTEGIFHKFTVIGYYNDVRRSVEIKYAK